MKSRIEVFVIAYLAWCLFAWVFGGEHSDFDIQSMLVGLPVAFLVAAVFGEGFAEKPGKALNPVRWLYFLVFLPVFAYYVIEANLQVTYLLLHPKMPIKPEIVRIETTLKSRAAITVLANCITLTPGTLTVEATDDGVLYVHWIEVRSTDPEEAHQMIAGKFEPLLKKIFEDE